MRFVLSLVLLTATTTSFAASDRPNILLVMADDLGFSDPGCYGSEIQTPNLDALAANGIRFTSFYNTARCWPTRAALLTGYYAQQVQRDNLPGQKLRRTRPKWARLVPAMLKTAGYRSYHSGKWHIDGMPIQNGFDRSYYLQDQGRFFSPKVHFLDDKKLPPVERGTGFYGTTAIASHAVDFLKQHADQHSDKPFFHYVAFTAPHFPLHALPEDIEKYKDKYTSGWEAIRKQRYLRQIQSGVVEAELSKVEKDVGPPYHFADHLKQLGPGEVNRPLKWDSLNEEQQAFQAAKMTLHAAMVDRIDQELGRIIAQLKQMNAFENTLILFLSDNGASAEIMVRTDGHDPAATPGSAASYLCLGPGWSTCCNTPFRRHKTWVHEGGISTPLIAHWPKGIRIRSRNQFRHSPGHVTDIVPTILELAEAKQFDIAPAAGVPAFPGNSLVSLFEKEDAGRRNEFWFCHEEHRALRQGNFKLVAAKGDPWELYDLTKDRAEQHNLAPLQPEKLKQLVDQWQKTTDAIIELAERFPQRTEKQKRDKARGQQPNPNSKTRSKTKQPADSRKKRQTAGAK